MELICPECLGALVPQPDGSARCQTHGGQYQVLFLRQAPAPPPPPPPTEEASDTPPYVPTVGAVCYQHSTVAAVFACRCCGKAICTTCAFREEFGTSLCPDCMANRSSYAPPPASVAGQKCVQHPNSRATQQCKLCGGYMCATCDFVLAGNIHLCPACAAKPQTALSPKRKRLLYGAFALAVWSTVGLACLVCGVFAGVHRSAADQQLLGTMLMLFVLGPALVGLGLALSTRDRRLANPPTLWIALVWNALIVGSFVLLTIIGLMMKG